MLPTSDAHLRHRLVDHHRRRVVVRRQLAIQHHERVAPFGQGAEPHDERAHGLPRLHVPLGRQRPPARGRGGLHAWDLGGPLEELDVTVDGGNRLRVDLTEWDLQLDVGLGDGGREAVGRAVGPAGAEPQRGHGADHDRDHEREAEDGRPRPAPLRSDPQPGRHHSVLRVRAGWKRPARHAGPRDSTSPSTSTTAGHDDERACGQARDGRHADRGGDRRPELPPEDDAERHPDTRPAAAVSTPCQWTARRASPGRNPSARRTPSSWRRWRTVSSSPNPMVSTPSEPIRPART